MGLMVEKYLPGSIINVENSFSALTWMLGDIISCPAFSEVYEASQRPTPSGFLTLQVAWRGHTCGGGPVLPHTVGEGGAPVAVALRVDRGHGRRSLHPRQARRRRFGLTAVGSPVPLRGLSPACKHTRSERVISNKETDSPASPGFTGKK